MPACESRLEPVRDDRTVPRGRYVDRYVWLAFDMDDFCTMLGSAPSVGRLILAGAIEVFDVHIFHGRTDIGESPRDTPVVAHNDKGHPGDRHSSYIKIPRA